MKPMIGISCMYSCGNEIGRATGMGLEGQDWNYLSGDYVYAIQRAGGIPVIIPHMKSEDALNELIDRLDGLLVTGGEDMDPRRYGQRMKGYCGAIVPERDEEDLAAIRRAYQNGKCILGICRGIQAINVAMGGTVYQDLEKEGGFEAHMVMQSPKRFPIHTDRFEEDSILRNIFGAEHTVNSYHHQAVREPGTNVTITAYSEDGVPEGIEVSGGAPFVVGVQWHPEMMDTSEDQQALFRAFVNACKP